MNMFACNTLETIEFFGQKRESLRYLWADILYFAVGKSEVLEIVKLLLDKVSGINAQEVFSKIPVLCDAEYPSVIRSNNRILSV